MRAPGQWRRSLQSATPFARPPSLQVPPATGDVESRRTPCRPPPHHWGVPCRPSDGQRSNRYDIVESLRLSMSQGEVAEYMEALEGRTSLRPRQSAARLSAAGKYPRTPGYSPGANENPLNAWAVKMRGARRRVAVRSRQARRAEGQYLPRRRADDERRLDARRLCAGYRRHRRHPHSRCRRHDRRQGALRVFLLVGRQPHQRARPGAQPAQAGLFGRRLVVGQRRRWSRAGEVEMAIGGDQGGSIRMPASFSRHLRHEADPRARALYRRHADRGDHRSYRPDDRDGRRQRAAAGGALPAPTGSIRASTTCKSRQYTAALGRGVAGMRIGVVTEGFGQPIARRTSTRRCARRPSACERSAPSSRRCPSPCTSTAAPSGRRSRSRACDRADDARQRHGL